MFRLYRSDNWERPTDRAVVDHADARKIATGVAMLPQPHREALQWNYIYGGSPTKARKRLGVTSDGLMLLIRDGRQMLINRGV
jgi:DNA-directed RNA polymerase specialized sigma24 family protein